MTPPTRALRRSLLLLPLLAAVAATPGTELPGQAPAEDAGADPSAEWEHQQSAEGAGYAYAVYSRRGEGEGFVRYRVRGTIRARAADLPRSAQVIAADPAWVPDGQSRRVIDDAPDQFVVYTRIDLPPFFRDRDIVSRGVASFDASRGAHRIEWHAVEHERAPPVAGVIRIERGAGSWEFLQADAETASVDYETYIDLGGRLPGWLIGPMMAGTVARNFEDLARHALGDATAAAR